MDGGYAAGVSSGGAPCSTDESRGYDHRSTTRLTLRHEKTSQFMSSDFRRELSFLGIRSTAAFIAEPENNGVAERFVLTLRSSSSGSRPSTTSTNSTRPFRPSEPATTVSGSSRSIATGQRTRSVRYIQYRLLARPEYHHQLSTQPGALHYPRV